MQEGSLRHGIERCFAISIIEKEKTIVIREIQ